MTKHNPHVKRPRRGFTLVELTVVIVVIGILAIIGIISYLQIQRQSRDSQRHSDITSLQNELEKFYDNNGTYPPGCPSVTCTNQMFLNNTSTAAFTATSTIAAVRSALPSIPVTFHDPSFNNSTHIFIGNGEQAGQYYYIGGGVNSPAGTLTATYAAAGVPCTFSTTLTASGETSSYVIGYRSEATQVWTFIGGKHGTQFTVTAGGCTIK